MRLAWCWAFMLVAGCSSDKPPASQAPEFPEFPAAPLPREIANTSIAFGMPVEPNGEATFEVSANASQLWVRFLMHESALGFSILQSQPGAGPARVELTAPNGDAWAFNVPGVFDFNPNPTAPWYAADGNQTAPQPGEWTLGLVGWGRNVSVDVIVREFTN